MQLTSKQKGLCCSLLATFCFSGMSAMAHLAGDLPSVQKALFRNGLALIVAAAMLLRRGVSLRVAPECRWSILNRSICGTLSVFCNFYALDHLVLADANMLNRISPFFAILFSRLLLKEKLSAAQLLGVCTAFCGALLIIRPSTDLLSRLPALIGAFGGLAAGLALTYVRKLGTLHENGTRVVFYFSLFSTMVTLPLALHSWQAMTTQQLFCLLATGLFATGGQFAITRSYYYAPARELSVYEYAQVLFAAVWGFCLFGQLPDGWSFLGYVIIISTAVVMFLYNNQMRPFRPKTAV